MARIEYDGYPKGEKAGRTIKAGELRRSSGYQTFTYEVNHRKINLPGEFKLLVYRPATLLFDQIGVTPTSDQSSFSTLSFLSR